MQRSTRLIITFTVIVLVAAFIVVAIETPPPTSSPTPSYSVLLTASEIVARATQGDSWITTATAETGGIRTATAQIIEATRTALAVTREPDLLTPHTPDSLQLTATQVMVDYEQTSVAFEKTPDSARRITGEMVETFIAPGTQTAVALTENPSLALTIFPTETPACNPYLYIHNHRDTEYEMRSVLQATGQMASTFVNIFTSGVATECGNIYPVRTVYQIEFIIRPPDDNNLARIGLTELALKVLQDFPPESDYGKEIRLHLLFRADVFLIKYIDTSYDNALAAYTEGLRGDALIEALGGLWDDDTDKYTLHTGFY